MALKLYLQSRDVGTLDKFIKTLTQSHVPTRMEVLPSTLTSEGTEHNRLLVWTAGLDQKILRKLQTFTTPAVVQVRFSGLEDN